MESEAARNMAAAAGTLKKLRRLYEGVERQRIRVDFSLVVNSSKVTLKAQDEDGNEAFAEGTKPEIAVNRAIDSKIVGEKLSKTGSTPFYAGKIEIQLEPGFTVPVSEINLLRRQVLENLLDIRGKTRAIAFKRPTDIEFSTENHNNVEKLRLRFRSISQIPQNINAYQVDMIFIPISEFAGDFKINLQKGLKVGVELPRAFFGDDRRLFEALQKAAAQGIKDALCGNLGAINIAKRAGFTIHGDFGLNITNSAAVETFVLQGAKSCVISFETPLSAVREIVSNSEAICGIIVYGRLPLMLVRNCPVRSFSGCKGGGCKISDRTGCDFPVKCCNSGLAKTGKNQASEILNSRPLWLADVNKEIKKANLNFAQFYFTTEGQSEVEKILAAWNSGEKYSGEFTRGLYFHSVT